MSNAADRIRTLSERLALELERIESAEQLDDRLQEIGAATAPPDVRYGELAVTFADVLELVKTEQGIMVDKWLKGDGSPATLARMGRLNRTTLTKRQRELSKELNRRED